MQADLQDRSACRVACAEAVEVYNLAADMGGMGFIENNKALCMLSVLINTHLLMEAKDAGVERFFFSSSACVYNADKQRDANVVPLKEEDAYPAMAEDGYGWEKLFSERMCRHFREDFGVETRVARFHNVYGPHGTWDGGREKAPAAVCRKVIHAVETGGDEIEIWGDGQQTRSFMYIDDCLLGIDQIMHSNILEPINLGSSELVTINQLVDIAEDIAGVKLKRRYKLDAPKGVNGRNSDNTRIHGYLGWEPSIRLRDGMAKTYAWIREQYLAQAPSPVLVGAPANPAADSPRSIALPAGRGNCKGRFRMSESVPRVTIGLPVYNGENYLAEAIESLLSQTFTDFELVICDNGSTDRTEQVCRAFAARDARIRYYRESQNRGLAWNFSRTFELARGRYFKWQAHDDLCGPTLLERSVEALDRDPALVLACARRTIIDHDGAGAGRSR